MARQRARLSERTSYHQPYAIRHKLLVYRWLSLCTISIVAAT
jgi:hypothetical protein